MPSFPDHFPPQCPFSEATEVDNMVVYRRTGHKNLTDADFKTHYEKHPNRYEKDCMARGLSVYTNKQDLYGDAQEKTGAMRKKKFIIEIQLNPSLGKIHNTSRNGDSHHTWWMYGGADPFSSCSVRELREHEL